MILFHYLFNQGLKSCKLNKPKDKAAVNVDKKHHKIKIKKLTTKIINLVKPSK